MSACSHCRLSYKLMLERYDEYCGCTRRGEHGKPAIYWMTYIDLVKIYLLLDRACRTNDVDLYIYALGHMLFVFFATHRPSYARWMTRYLLNLINMKHSHPGIRPIFYSTYFKIVFSQCCGFNARTNCEQGRSF